MAIVADPGVAKWQADVAARGQARMGPEIQKLMAELAPVLQRDEKRENAARS